MLTSKQLAALRFIDAEIKRTGGVSPTFKEIGRHMGVKSTNSVYAALTQLEERGFIKRHYARRRSIEVIRLPDLPRTCPNCGAKI